MNITKYISGQDWMEPHVVTVDFTAEIDGVLLRAVDGHRRRAKRLLHSITVKADDERLFDTHNECVDAIVERLRKKIKPTLDRINDLILQKDIEPYKPDVHHAPALGLNQEFFESIHRD